MCRVEGLHHAAERGAGELSTRAQRPRESRGLGDPRIYTRVCRTPVSMNGRTLSAWSTRYEGAANCMSARLAHRQQWRSTNALCEQEVPLGHTHWRTRVRNLLATDSGRLCFMRRESQSCNLVFNSAEREI